MEVSERVERLPLSNYQLGLARRSWLYPRLPPLRGCQVGFDRVVLVELGLYVIVYTDNFLRGRPLASIQPSFVLDSYPTFCSDWIKSAMDLSARYLTLFH
jgi:hypothetical protein